MDTLHNSPSSSHVVDPLTTIISQEMSSTNLVTGADLKLTEECGAMKSEDINDETSRFQYEPSLRKKVKQSIEETAVGTASVVEVQKEEEVQIEVSEQKGHSRSSSSRSTVEFSDAQQLLADDHMTATHIDLFEGTGFQGSTNHSTIEEEEAHDMMMSSTIRLHGGLAKAAESDVVGSEELAVQKHLDWFIENKSESGDIDIAAVDEEEDEEDDEDEDDDEEEGDEDDEDEDYDEGEGSRSRRKTLEGLSQATNEEEKKKYFEDLMEILPPYIFCITPEEKEEFFASLNEKFKRNLSLDTNPLPHSHSKKVVFAFEKVQTVEFDLNKKVKNISKLPIKEGQIVKQLSDEDDGDDDDDDDDGSHNEEEEDL